MYIFFAIIIILLFAIILVHNSIVKLRNNVDKSKSGIDVYLQQRFDLIPNLIEVTKGYMNYERDLLDKIAELRSIYNQSKDMQAGNELNSQYKTIMATAENYPELKASEQFLNLQKNLVKIESELQAARRIYNNDVTRYNIKISTFPNSLIAWAFRFRKRELFVLDGEDKVEVSF